MSLSFAAVIHNFVSVIIFQSSHENQFIIIVAIIYYTFAALELSSFMHKFLSKYIDEFY